MDVIALGPMDLVMPRYYTRVAFLLENLPTTASLEATFRLVVSRHYAPYTGTLKNIDGGRIELLYHHQPTEQDLAACFQVRLASKGLSFASLGGAAGTFGSPLPAELFHPSPVPQPDEPVLRVLVSRFDGDAGGAINVTLHHCVGDGGALFGFVRAWCAQLNGVQVPSATHDRSVIPKSMSNDLPVPTAYQLPPSPAPPTAAAAPMQFPPMNPSIFRFSPAALAHLKATAVASLHHPCARSRIPYPYSNLTHLYEW